jgi:hypothetical protein
MKLQRDETITVERVQALLRQRAPGVMVDSVEVVGESEGSASRLQLEVDYAPGTRGGLPQRFFLKRNLAEFTFPPQMYLTECRFYRDLEPELPSLETPVVHAMELDESTGAFVLLMEDLAVRARLGIALERCTVNEVAAVLDDVAELHAKYWGDDARVAEQFPWLDRADQSAFIRFWLSAGPKLARKNLAGHRAPVVEHTPWVHDRLWPALASLVAQLGRAPLTVLHGDLHIGNTYFTADGGGGLLDWQLMLHGNWVVDVAYVVHTAFEPEERARYERTLLAGYLDALRRRGVEAPDESEAWRSYCSCAVWGVVMWVVTPDGVHTDEAQRVSLRRSIAAAEELSALDRLGA